MDANGKLGAKSKLSDLLAQADTWDKFQSIVIEREPFQNAAVLGVPNNSPLPMSGIYVDNENLTHPDDWTKVEPYQIPLSKNGLNLKGSIHLRRPFTQVKFNVSVSEDIVSFDVESYRVYNVPTYGWLYERSQSDDLTNRIDYANAGDAMQPIVDDNTNYKPSLVYPSTNITENNGVYSFDFWMMENKRTGVLTSAPTIKSAKESIKTLMEQIRASTKACAQPPSLRSTTWQLMWKYAARSPIKTETM